MGGIGMMWSTKMTTEQRDAIADPFDGLRIWNDTTEKWNVYDEFYGDWVVMDS
jgi:hypothetical protein